MALSPRTMQIESCRCNSVSFQDRVWEPHVCTMKRKWAYPQLRACKGSSLPKGAGTSSSEWGGGCRLACLLVWPHLLLSPVGRLPCPVCGPFFCAFSKIPLLGPITWSGRLGPILSCGVILYHRIFTPSLEALISCSAQVFWHLEHTMWSCSAWGSEGPTTCLHASSSQEVFSERWPLTVMRQCREASPEWIGGYSGSACFAVGDTMVLVSFGELHDPSLCTVLL